MNGWINKRHGDCLYRLTASRVGREHGRQGGRRYDSGETQNKLTFCDASSLSRDDADARWLA